MKPMKVAFFDTKKFETAYFGGRTGPFEFSFFETRLNGSTVELAKGFDAVCIFVNDRLDEPVIRRLRELGVGMATLRCAGFNNVDLKAAEKHGLTVTRVPKYSPHAVAEFTVALMLSLNRKIHKAFHRVKDFNFTLDGLIGFDMNGKTVGLLGTGEIGSVAAGILRGFGCRILAYDLKPSEKLIRECEVRYTGLDQLIRESDIVSLHLPLNDSTHHILDEKRISRLKPGAMIVNTGRGGLIDTKALIQGLKSGRIGSVALDVYEEEENYFFRDFSDQIMNDDDLARLLTFPNVLLTSHQAYLTDEALKNIAAVTLDNLLSFASGHKSPHQISA